MGILREETSEPGSPNDRAGKGLLHGKDVGAAELPDVLGEDAEVSSPLSATNPREENCVDTHRGQFSSTAAALVEASAGELECTGARLPAVLLHGEGRFASLRDRRLGGAVP
ncbi:hypothetical protein [Sciscionella sediminilitoris]|uniref:hypothetical protein n=1 Tax=Sciscionella sediminilitoris TaxID=1445613 RepID=UPI0012E306D3|nr:hypothetical protein [Sciscionella sp. SE31]